jgi:hypothetical protein
MKNLLELDAGGIAFATLSTEGNPVGNFVVGGSSELGRKWDGAKFIDAPKKYKVWTKTAFVTICGQAVFDAIVDGNSKPLRYFKYILDSATVVDLNIKQYFDMVKQLNDVGIMSNEIFAVLTAKE